MDEILSEEENIRTNMLRLSLSMRLKWNDNVNLTCLSCLKRVDVGLLSRGAFS